MTVKFKLAPTEPTDAMIRAGMGVGEDNCLYWKHPQQAYLDMLAVAPQPPALGADLGDDLDDALRDMASVACQSALSHGIGEHEFLKLARTVRHLVEAPLQAEIDRLKYDLGTCELMRDIAYSERDQLKARRDELEGLLREMRNENYTRLKDIANMHDRVDAALSKPAGSEQV